MLVIILRAVVLSVCIGFGDCWWTSGIRICLIISVFLVLMKTPAILVSADHNITCSRIEHLLRIGLLSGGCFVGVFEGSDCSELRDE